MIAAARLRLSSGLGRRAAVTRAYSNAASPASREVDEDMPVSDMENPYKKAERCCILCEHGIRVDYKNVRLLSQFVSSYTGNTYEKHITGLCQKQQDRVVLEIRRAKLCGMMPFYIKFPEFLRDPKLFDPFRPSRPNPH